jgi:hypothetical protein
MTTGDVFLIIWVAASLRIMWLLCKLWVHNVGASDDEYWDACMIRRNSGTQSFSYEDIT